MPGKDPQAWGDAAGVISPVLPWVGTILLSIFATLAQYAAKVRAGEAWSWAALGLDAAVCVFVGLTTHLLCEWGGVDGYGRSFLVAVSAHMGTKAMVGYQRWRDRALGLGDER